MAQNWRNVFRPPGFVQTLGKGLLVHTEASGLSLEIGPHHRSRSSLGNGVQIAKNAFWDGASRTECDGCPLKKPISNAKVYTACMHISPPPLSHTQTHNTHMGVWWQFIKTNELQAWVASHRVQVAFLKSPKNIQYICQADFNFFGGWGWGGGGEQIFSLKDGNWNERHLDANYSCLISLPEKQTQWQFGSCFQTSIWKFKERWLVCFSEAFHFYHWTFPTSLPPVLKKGTISWSPLEDKEAELWLLTSWTLPSLGLSGAVFC